MHHFVRPTFGDGTGILALQLRPRCAGIVVVCGEQTWYVPHSPADPVLFCWKKQLCCAIFLRTEIILMADAGMFIHWGPVSQVLFNSFAQAYHHRRRVCFVEVFLFLVLMPNNSGAPRSPFRWCAKRSHAPSLRPTTPEW